MKTVEELVFWTNQTSFRQLDFIIDLDINFQKSRNGLNEDKGQIKAPQA